MIKKIIILSVLTFSLSGLAGLSGHHHHQHDNLDVSKEEAIPAIKLVAHKDAASGWNLEIITENFKFAPQSVNQEHVLGQGHAHLYIDGVKIGRLYGNWYHLNKLGEGKYEVKVSLNTNNHKAYSLGEQAIAATIMVGE